MKLAGIRTAGQIFLPLAPNENILFSWSISLPSDRLTALLFTNIGYSSNFISVIIFHGIDVLIIVCHHRGYSAHKSSADLRRIQKFRNLFEFALWIGHQFQVKNLIWTDYLRAFAIKKCGQRIMQVYTYVLAWFFVHISFAFFLLPFLKFWHARK